MTGKQIVEKALSIGSKSVYWYGGKRQTPTIALAKTLRKENPKVWTEEYYEAALKDVGGAKLVCDCSGLVCGAYGISDIGTATMCSRFQIWTPAKAPFKPGMIAWRAGHCGIIYDKTGHVYEMRGLKWDFCKNRTFESAGFTYVLYDPAVNYEENDHNPGWHFDEGEKKWWYATGWNAGDYHRAGFYKIGNAWYYFNTGGWLVTGVFTIGTVQYASTENGILIPKDKNTETITTIERLKEVAGLTQAR